MPGLQIIMQDTGKQGGALSIAGVQSYCKKYSREVRGKYLVAIIEEAIAGEENNEEDDQALVGE